MGLRSLALVSLIAFSVVVGATRIGKLYLGLEPVRYLSKSLQSNKPSVTPIPQSTYRLNGEYIHNILIRVIDVSCVGKEGNRWSGTLLSYLCRYRNKVLSRDVFYFP